MTNRKQDLLDLIQGKRHEMSKGQKRIADFITGHYDKAAFMTAARLGETVGVSESTVVRFAMMLGFDGYPELQKVLQELIKRKLTAAQRIEVSSNRISEGNVLKSVLQSDMEKIKQTLETIDRESFDKAVECLLNARNIYILGVRSSAFLASFLGFYFNLIFDNVRLINTSSASEMFEQILRASEGDAVIGISYPRYSKRTTKAVHFVKSQGATVIAITDSMESPLAATADHCLIARSDMASFADSLVAPLSVINALIVACGNRRKEEVYNTLQRLEEIWDEYQVYEKNDNIEHHRKVDH